jgi:hypothetical protein
MILSSIKYLILLICLIFHLGSIDSTVTTVNPTKVVITGAGSAVGYLVFKKLLARKNFYPIGLVKDSHGAAMLSKLGVGIEQIKICDVRHKEELKGLFNGIYI